MLTEDEVTEVVDELKGFARELDDDVTGDVSQEQDGTTLTGFSCYDEYYGRKYDVFHVSGPDAEAFTIRFGYDLVTSIAFDLRKEDVENLLDVDVDEVSPNDVDTPTDVEIRAATRIADEIDREGMARMKFQLWRQISNPKVRTKIHTTHQGSIRSFDVRRSIFPTEDGFGLSDFYDAKTAVLSTGKRGTRFLDSTLSVDVNSEGVVEELISMSPVRL